MKKIVWTVGIVALVSGVAQAAVITYSENFNATLVSGLAMKVTGTPVLLEDPATDPINYAGIYEAGKQVGITTTRAPGTDQWMNFATDSDNGLNSIAFFDLGSILNAADGDSVTVDFLMGTDSSNKFDDGTVKVSLYSGLSDVTFNGTSFLMTTDEAALYSQTITISIMAYYDEIYGDDTAAYTHTESLTFSGLTGVTAENLYLVFDFETTALDGGAGTGMINDLVVNQIPEPASLGLIAATGVSVLFIRRRLMM